MLREARSQNPHTNARVIDGRKVAVGEHQLTAATKHRLANKGANTARPFRRRLNNLSRISSIERPRRRRVGRVSVMASERIRHVHHVHMRWLGKKGGEKRGG